MHRQNLPRVWRGFVKREEKYGPIAAVVGKPSTRGDGCVDGRCCLDMGLDFRCFGVYMRGELEPACSANTQHVPRVVLASVRWRPQELKLSTSIKTGEKNKDRIPCRTSGNTPRKIKPIRGWNFNFPRHNCRTYSPHLESPPPRPNSKRCTQRGPLTQPTGIQSVQRRNDKKHRL